MIKWKEEYRIGVLQIDQQHIQLFNIADRAYALLTNKMLSDKYDKIIEILEELRDYTVYHFKYEEEYMTSIGYTKFLSHKVLHDDFIEKINSVDLSKIDDNQSQYLLGILEFVVEWIENHILGQDKRITADKR